MLREIVEEYPVLKVLLCVLLLWGTDQDAELEGGQGVLIEV